MNQTGQDIFDQLASRVPVFTAVSDEPVAAQRARETDHTAFELIERVGPVYDILRHPNTQTPLAVAIYGGWGTGKTTAMRWLQGMLEEWRSKYRKKDQWIDVCSVWFSPWKYQTQEEVWRGLIAEVILETLRIQNANVATVTNAVRLFGRFLGRSFLHAAEALTIKTKIGASGTGAEAELKLSALKNIADEFDRMTHPESAYLNDFEQTLRSWIQPFIRPKGSRPERRLVVFIDDLDRCMPKIALQVLEALKLYLGIPGLIFVVGVDDTVVEQQVIKHFHEQGVGPDKARMYLAKMFQVEARLVPGEERIGGYIQGQLTASGVWVDPYVSDEARGVFEEVIALLAKRNPREVKRLINGAAMAGVGNKLPGSARVGDDRAFTSGAQRFLLDYQWHELDPRQRDKDAPWRADFLGSMSGERILAEFSRLVRGAAGDGEVVERGSEKDDPVAAFIEKSQEWLQPVLRDKVVRLLMGLEFVPDVGTPVEQRAAPTGTTDPLQVPEIRDAIATSLGKSPEELTAKDPPLVVSLDLSGTAVTDLTPLSGLDALAELILSATEVTDLTPLSGLEALGGLRLHSTKVKDLTPLAGLTALTELYLGETQVTDLTPLSGLTALRNLDLEGTQVTDLTPLSGLKALMTLDVNGTKVADLTPLSGLKALERLYLSEAQVTDLTPLSRLTALGFLVLRDTQVTDLAPLARLTALRGLHLEGTEVRNLGPLHGLTQLVRLSLTNTKVTAEEIARLKEALPKLKIKRR